MATARITRGDHVVEVDGITAKAAEALLFAFLPKPEQVAAPGVAGDQELAETRTSFGFAPIEGFTAPVGVSH